MTKNRGRLYHFDGFSYLDGYDKCDNTLGIRVVKVEPNEGLSGDLSEECKGFQPFILVHSYRRNDIQKKN